MHIVVNSVVFKRTVEVGEMIGRILALSRCLLFATAAAEDECDEEEEDEGSGKTASDIYQDPLCLCQLKS